ncbi:hypothetical protein ACFWPK_34445 [Nocardia sp. NPDC058519]|uniref:hypothetical protein n=1 Tax=Nocardia sp. NPDC058519 TaxID=3346535 RepID=UPI003649B6AA
MTDPNPVVAALLASGRRELAEHRVTNLRTPKPAPTEDTAVIDAETPADPIPADDQPHAYVAIKRTHSPYADRPEWAEDIHLIPAHQASEIAYWRTRPGYTLLAIGPDGDTGTRWMGDAVIDTLIAQLKEANARADHLAAQLAEAQPEYPTCDTCGRVQVHGTVYAECECP